MSGIYIHIPYCRKKCSYCNFYFLVSMKTVKPFVDSLLNEIEITKEYLIKKELKSIYFGGGTPSVLQTNDLQRILNKIEEIYTYNNNIEITLEANPDDITEAYIKKIVEVGINRLSIGVQSFSDSELKLFGRTHDSSSAINAIKISKEYGIENLNIDLIFGVPGSDRLSWKKNLDIFLDLNVDHLSCYNLTVENKTAISHQIKKGLVKGINDEISSEQFTDTIDYLCEMGFEHYEISNYAKNGRYAIHNTNYWKGEHYLGLGPSAHSYNGEYRQWNISNLRQYIQSTGKGNLPIGLEKLSNSDKYNEYIMTGLRTMWGIDLKHILQFDKEIVQTFLENINSFIDNGYVAQNNDKYFLTKTGKLFADRIASELFVS
ncbi:MAG: radical SAM family heme chaperone HemW [Saprospiraceae bacterium]|nr:radical SAM family heme chaperone HemW [Saprospiraceae bacterium]